MVMRQNKRWTGHVAHIAVSRGCPVLSSNACMKKDCYSVDCPEVGVRTCWGWLIAIGDILLKDRKV